MKTLEDIKSLLSVSSKNDLENLFAAAYAAKVRLCGHKVALRGLVEAGNVCSKDCYYCGIRRSNASLSRYTLSADEIVKAAEFCKQENYASLVIQSGEVESEAHTRFIEEVLRRIRPLDLGVTLSLGEQTEDVYRRWREAGASRYLLRIETSNPELYARLHPANHSWRRRVDCLRTLHDLGYQTGTGVMCALPGQTLDDLARDILFFSEIDADMIGMGPYIPHPDTPLGTVPEQTGTVPNQTGTDPAQTGTVPAQTGTDPAQMGTVPEQTGTDPTQTGTVPAQMGTDPAQTGTVPEQSKNRKIEKSKNFSDNLQYISDDRLLLGLKMIAVTRLFLPDVNIAASTALQTLAPDGRARGILAGANVIMPNVTETRYRRGYQLYEGKPNLDENAADARQALEAELAAIGETIDYGRRGDSAHYHARTS